MVSKFLPTDFDKNKKIGLIAGRGDYPLLVLNRLQEKQLSIRLLAFEDETTSAVWDRFEDNERAIQHVGQIGKLLKNIEKFDLGYVIMAGQITPKKLFKGLNPDLKALSLLMKLKEKNAESIFGTLAMEIEKAGTKLLDARAFLDDQLAEKGVMTGGKLPIDNSIIEHGIRTAKAIADLNIGQGIVVSKGTVLAVEAFEGTDKMLARAGEFKAKDTVFIKTVKPNQDYRFDVPVFGMQTVEAMIAAEIQYAGLEAGKVIILEKQKTIEAAKKQGIVLFGY